MTSNAERTAPGRRASLELATHAQRKWLLEHFAADKVIVTATVPLGKLTSRAYDSEVKPGEVLTRDTYAPGDTLVRTWKKWGLVDIVVHPAARCFFCGKLLGRAALFVNKVDPNGTTRRNNIRPACRDHATLTTATLVANPGVAAELRASFERSASAGTSRYFACDGPDGELSLVVERTEDNRGWVINGGWSGTFRNGVVTVDATGRTHPAPVVWEGDELKSSGGDYGFAYVNAQLGRKS